MWKLGRDVVSLPRCADPGVVGIACGFAQIEHMQKCRPARCVGRLEPEFAGWLARCGKPIRAMKNVAHIGIAPFNQQAPTKLMTTTAKRWRYRNSGRDLAIVLAP